MNSEELRKKLVQSARHVPVSDAVPLAFEQRVMAQIRAVPAQDPLAMLGRLLWGAAAPCVALALLVVGLATFPNTSSDAGTDVSISAATTVDLESTMLAQLDTSAEITVDTR